MTATTGAYAENGDMIGSVKFSDSSAMNIRSRGTIIFRCQNREPTDVYYILRLRRASLALSNVPRTAYRCLI